MKLKLPAVVDAARQWVAAWDQGVINRHYGTYVQIARIAGYDADTSGWQQRHEWDAFTGQVNRALDKLAEEGLLVRVGNDLRGPDGVRRRGVTYFKAADAARAAEDRARKDADKLVLRARWAVVADRLRGLGLDPGTTATSVDLTITEWEILLGRLS